MICICIAYKSYDQCRRILNRVELAELRIDLLDLNKKQISKLFSLPTQIIATCREGKYSDNERMELLETAILGGATYVDIELEMQDKMRDHIIRLARKNKCKIIVSYHNFKLTPPLPELRSVINKCRESGADFVKISCQVNNADDAATLMSLYSKEKNIISFGMGEDGLITRLAAPILGAKFTYAAADRESKTGPGQVTGKEMRYFYKMLGYQDLL